MKHLKSFGSLVSVRIPGKRSEKLDKITFHGIFLGYTATDKIFRYWDINTKRDKTGNSVHFDEAHYTASTRPPGPQILYDLGFTQIDEVTHLHHTNIAPTAVYPSFPKDKVKPLTNEHINIPLPLLEYTSQPHAATAKLELP